MHWIKKWKNSRNHYSNFFRFSLHPLPLPFPLHVCFLFTVMSFCVCRRRTDVSGSRSPPSLPPLPLTHAGNLWRPLPISSPSRSLEAQPSPRHCMPVNLCRTPRRPTKTCSHMTEAPGAVFGRQRPVLGEPVQEPVSRVGLRASFLPTVNLYPSNKEHRCVTKCTNVNNHYYTTHTFTWDSFKFL